MTTIACKGGVMAADMRATSGYTARVQKIVQLSDGTIVGGAGTMAQVQSAFVWLERGGKGEAPDISDSALLFLKPDGSIWNADSTFPAFRIEDESAAIGSGQMIAMYVMATGGDAIEAVQAASTVDPYTGDEVQYFELPKRKKAKKMSK